MKEEMMRKEGVKMPPRKGYRMLGFYADKDFITQIDGFGGVLAGAGFTSFGKGSRKTPSRSDIARLAAAFVIEEVPLARFVAFCKRKRAEERGEKDLQLKLIEDT